MFWLQVVVAVGIVLATVLVAGGRGDGLAPVEAGRRRAALPEDRALVPADFDALDLGVGFRGYRMDEVDEVIDRVVFELAERDERIAELESRTTVAARPLDRPVDRPTASGGSADRTDG